MKNILIGGIPRGGTTVTLRMLDEFSDVFMWPGETWILSLARNLWAGGAPNPACRAEAERYAVATLRRSLIEMQEWNAEYGSVDCLRPADDVVEALGRRVVAGAYDAASVRGSLLAGANVLSDFLSSVSDKPIRAEKTPDNIFAFTHLGDAKSFAWILCHREPFATIASIRERAERDPYAVNWSKDIEFCIGVYLSYAERVLSAMRASDTALVAAYDATCAAPFDFLVQIARLLGQRRPAPRKINFVVPAQDREKWRRFTPEERWKVLNFTAPVRRLLGYDESYYGCAETAMTGDATFTGEFSVVPVSGLHEAEQNPGRPRWMSGEAVFAVYAPENVAAISAQVYNPGALGRPNQRLIVSDGSQRLSEDALFADKHITVSVDLRRARPVGVFGKMRAYLIKLQTTERCLPVVSIPGSDDQRVIACSITDWRPTIVHDESIEDLWLRAV